MFNVCDREGRHLGFVSGTSTIAPSWEVALCKTPLDDSAINWEVVRKRLADIFECRNMWGKVNEDLLMNKMKMEWNKEYARDEQRFYPTTDKDYMKFMFIKFARDYSKCYNLTHHEIQGYIYLDVNTPIRDQDYIHLDSNLKYIQQPILNTPPHYGVVAGFPKISLNRMGFIEGFFLGANWSDFGGRNHTHSTLVKIASGNVEVELRFPLQIPFKVGEPVQIYFANNGAVTSIFYDEAIYVLKDEDEDVGRPAYSFDGPGE